MAVCRVLPDVPAIDKEFDYSVPEDLTARVGPGTIVRIPLHGRRVRGWVTAVGVTPPPGVRLQPLLKVSSVGPPAELLTVATWAAWRWAGRRALFLRTASPPVMVGGLPAPAGRSPTRTTVGATATTSAVLEALGRPRSVLRIPPSTDVLPLVEQAAAAGPTLVIAASTSVAAAVLARLRRAGCPVAAYPREWARAAAGGVTVVGTRSAAWAPMPAMAAVVVLDGHDQAHHEERAPTWVAWTVGAERAQRRGVPCVISTPMPTLELLEWANEAPVALSRAEERLGWPALEVVDRRRDDPRSGLFSERLVAALRGPGRAVCVVNRKARAALVVCAACGELAHCERCEGGMAQGEDHLRCRRCGHTRAEVCAACGSQRLKRLRIGVSRVREELTALVGEPVGEVTGEAGDVPTDRVVVGTEAVLHRVPEAATVAFLDFDQELLAARFHAGEDALALLARAARLVGGRRGRVLVQTRLPRHPVLAAALHADPARLTDAEGPRRRVLRLPPYAALALVSGEAAAAFVDALAGVEVAGPVDGVWRVRAPDHASLCDALAAAPRPPGRLRVEVDPVRA